MASEKPDFIPNSTLRICSGLPRRSRLNPIRFNLSALRADFDITKSGFMYLAIKEARKNLKDLFGGPFGACIVNKNKILALSRNTVFKSNDPTSHAEINAIRIAAKKLKNFDLSGCEIYSTTEPCPMCFSAIHWANIDKIYYGTSISDVKKLGFNELTIKNAIMKKLGKSKVKISQKFMLKECKQLLCDWKKLPNKIQY